MISTETMTNKELANELASYINEIEGDLEVQNLLSPEKRLPQVSLDCLRESLNGAKARFAELGYVEVAL